MKDMRLEKRFEVLLDEDGRANHNVDWNGEAFLDPETDNTFCSLRVDDASPTPAEWRRLQNEIKMECADEILAFACGQMGLALESSAIDPSWRSRLTKYHSPDQKR